MAKITKYEDIDLDRLIIGKGQVRTQEPGKDIPELAESIKVQGLLQPIVVCPAREAGKWEILTGQRRFLAHKFLQKETISAAILDERVEIGEAKSISITENLIRRKLSGKELTDGILYLYNVYGSIKAVAETTGLPNNSIRDHVKYPRLIPELRKMVDDNEVDVKVALKAQDAATAEDDMPDAEVAIKLACEMSPMSGAQQKNLAKLHKMHPEKPIDDVIEDVKTGARVIQVMATVTQDTHAAIRQFARSENTNQDEATAILIEYALVERGLLG